MEKAGSKTKISAKVSNRVESQNAKKGSRIFSTHHGISVKPDLDQIKAEIEKLGKVSTIDNIEL